MRAVHIKCFPVRGQKKRNIFFIILFCTIFIFMYLSQKNVGNPKTQRKINSLRHLRRRSLNNVSSMSEEMSESTIRDNILSSTSNETMSDPVTTTINPEKMTKAQKISLRDQFKPFQLPANYSKNVIPSPQAAYIHRIETSEELEQYKAGIEPVKIHVGVKLEGVQVNELDEELVLSLQLFLKWDDAFIQLDNTKGVVYPGADSAKYFRTLDPSFADQIWKPDLFLENLVKVSQPKLISPLLTLNINPYTGTIIYLSRLLIKIACSMDFQYYPFDTQKCEIKIRSNSYISTEMILQWEDVVLLNTDEANFDVQLNDFDTYSHIDEFTGYFYKQISALKFTILARRKISYHMVQSFLPSIFFVFITWLCFLIPSKSFDVRIGIAMTTLLTLTAMFASIRESTPIVSYVKAIDVWMVFCIFFVFGTLLEFAIVVYLDSYVEFYKEREMKKIKSIEKHSLKMSSSTLDGNESEDFEMKPRVSSHEQIIKTNMKKEEIIQLRGKAKYLEYLVTYIEKYAFIAFATNFIIFNTIYWWWLVESSDYRGWNIEKELNEI